MGETYEKHRPLVSGIWVWSGKKIGNQLQPIALSKSSLKMPRLLPHSS